MWDWIDYTEGREDAEDLQIDFDPMARTKDPLAGDDPVQDDNSDGDGDLYENEDELFEKTQKKYIADPEMEVGFPDDKQEYDATPCLEEVLEEYQSYQRGRALKPITQGMGLMLYGDADFFAKDQVDD